MEKNKLQIRVATKEDAEALLAIYAPYVEKTAITFEYEVPSIEEFCCRIQGIAAVWNIKPMCKPMAGRIG